MLQAALRGDRVKALRHFRCAADDDHPIHRADLPFNRGRPGKNAGAFHAERLQQREVQAGGNYYFSENVRIMADAFVPFKRLPGAPRMTLVTRLQFMF